MKHPKISKIIAFTMFLAGFMLIAQDNAAELTHKVQLPKQPIFIDAPAKQEFKHPKLASVLLRLTDMHAKNKVAALEFGDNRDLMIENDEEVLVEVRFDKKAADQVRGFLEKFGMRVRHHNADDLFESWLPIGKLRDIVENESIQMIRPARKVVQLTGASNSQGVAVSLANNWHTAGFDGTGITLANIDGGFVGYGARQATNDWPSGAQVTLVDVDGGGFGLTGGNHGVNTVEINYDMAPGATYRVYETTTVGDWYTAIVNATANGADVISASLGAPLDGIGDGTALPGSIAEASQNARNAGVLVVNAAGNEREQHWGGLYSNYSGLSGTHDWGGTNANFCLFCIPNGFTLAYDFYWDDWTGVNHDYDLQLYEINGLGSFVLRDDSTFTQSGLGGQTPQEIIRYTVSGAFGGSGCPAGTGAFALVVRRISAATNRNLQIFMNFEHQFIVNARSLAFPADSPAVMTVAADDVTSPYPIEDYSSEGPVLGPGGSLAATTIEKPDITAYANVDTQASGAGGFNGTSAATPHVAGAAALVLDAFPSYIGYPDAVQEFLENCAIDQGPAGQDTRYGIGRLVLCDGTFDTWTRDNTLDVGNEPHLAGSIWNSPDIRICQTQGCVGSMNPEFGQTNYVYVTLRNTGPNAIAPNQPAAGEIEVYYSNSGGSAQWPIDWTLINSVPVSLAAGEVREIEIPWTSVPAVGHYCMLSRWVSADDPMTFVEVAQTTTNVRNNNNISWKNFNVVNLVKSIRWKGKFWLRNVSEKANVFQLRMGNMDFFQKESFVGLGGEVEIMMDEKLFARWLDAGAQGEGIEVVDNNNTIRLVNDPAMLLIPMDPAERQELCVTMIGREPTPWPDEQAILPFHMVQFDQEGKEELGGVAFDVHVRGRFADTDRDGILDVDDKDDDNDGVLDNRDEDPLDPKVRKAGPEIVINLDENTVHGDVNGAVTIVSDAADHQAVIKLNLGDSYEKAVVEVAYSDTPNGWSLDMGSPDDSGQKVSLENGSLGLQVVESTMSFYGTDALMLEDRLAETQHDVVAKDHSLVLEISRDQLTWKHTNVTESLNTEAPFRFSGKNDGNGDVFMAFNRTIASAEQAGSGVGKVTIKLIPKAEQQ